MGGREALHPLKDWLTEQAGAARAEITELPALLPGGAVQQNWALEMLFDGGKLPGRQNLVLRSNFQTLLPASRSKAEEFALQRAAEAAGIAVPEPLYLCEDNSVIGQPFYVMRRCAGVAAARALVAAAARDGFGDRLAGELAGALARLHAIAPGAPGEPGAAELAWLGAPAPSSALAQIAQLRGWLAALEPAPGTLDRALGWLARHAPEQQRTCLVHRDFRSGNFLVEVGRLVAVLDWEFAGWGEPHEDIGWLCAACWRAGGDHLEAGGLAARDTFYRAYEAAGGGPIDAAAVAYWEVFAHVRWAVIALQQGMRARRGDGPQHELREAASRLPGLERAIAAQIAAA